MWNRKNIFNIGALVLLLVGIPLGTYLVRQQQIFKSKASVDTIKFAGDKVDIRNNRIVSMDKKVGVVVNSPFETVPTATPTPTGIPTPTPLANPSPRIENLVLNVTDSALDTQDVTLTFTTNGQVNAANLSVDNCQRWQSQTNGTCNEPTGGYLEQLNPGNTTPGMLGRTGPFTVTFRNNHPKHTPGNHLITVVPYYCPNPAGLPDRSEGCVGGPTDDFRESINITGANDSAVSAVCDANNRATISWVAATGATNYTVRINKEPAEWNPDYTGTDREAISTADRAFEAGLVTTTSVNLSAGSYLDATIQAKNGATSISTQTVSRFSCPNGRTSSNGGFAQSVVNQLMSYLPSGGLVKEVYAQTGPSCPGFSGEYVQCLGTTQANGTNATCYTNGTTTPMRFICYPGCGSCNVTAPTATPVPGAPTATPAPAATATPVPAGGSCPVGPSECAAQGLVLSQGNLPRFNASGQCNWACTRCTAPNTPKADGTGCDSPTPPPAAGGGGGGSAPTATPVPAGSGTPVVVATPTLIPTLAPLRTQTAAPAGTVTTGFKVSEIDSADAWSIATLNRYSAGSENKAEYTFTPVVCVTTPCDTYPRKNRRVFVQFIGRKLDSSEYKEVWSADIILALPPKIDSTACSLQATGTGTLINIKGEHFGDDVGSVKYAGQTATVTSGGWNNLEITASSALPLADNKDVIVTTIDGQFSTPVVCGTGKSQIDFKATLACRSSEKALSVGDIEIKEDTPQAKSVFKKEGLTFDATGRPQGLIPELVEGKSYKLIIKSPNTLSKVIKFIAGAGATGLEAMDLPLGDVAPDRGDGQINQLDRSKLMSEWAAGKESTKKSDLNLDGRVNSLDYSCLMSNFRKESDKL